MTWVGIAPVAVRARDRTRARQVARKPLRVEAISVHFVREVRLAAQVLIEDDPDLQGARR